jgi:soluble lytic murein transglycosylase-like protein
MQVISPIATTGSATASAGTGATGNSGVLGAIQGASRATGASFDYLLTTARVESNFNPTASAKTSSAKGLFQFIDSTWLSTMKQSGGALGYGRYANAITHNASDGIYIV